MEEYEYMEQLLDDSIKNWNKIYFETKYICDSCGKETILYGSVLLPYKVYGYHIIPRRGLLGVGLVCNSCYCNILAELSRGEKK